MLEAASQEEDERQRGVALARKYHYGDQQALITDRLKEFMPSVDLGEPFRLNICRVVVTAMLERMRVTGFDSSDTDKIEWAATTWDDCRGPVIEQELYETLLRDGEAFLIIDTDLNDQGDKVIRWYPNQRFTDLSVDGGDGLGCRAYYENDDPNQKMKFATKEWPVLESSGRTTKHRNIYYPDHIVKQHHDGQIWVTDDVADWKSKDGKPLGIPVIHFYNKGFKREAEDAFTPQDAINKTFLDLLTTSDAAAFRVYVALGWIPTIDGKAPAEDRSNWLQVNPGDIVGTDKPKSDVSFEAIEPADLGPVIDVVQQNILWASMTTNTPASRFISTKLIASDETLKQQEEPLVAKIDGVKMLISYAWREVITITERVALVLEPDIVLSDKRVKPIWNHSASLESLMALLKDKQTLRIPIKQLWREMGYDEQKINVMWTDMLEQAKLLTPQASTTPTQ